MAEWIINFINNYGIIAICLIVMIEYACFPLPSEVVLPLSGAICVELNFNFFAMVGLTTLSGLIGASICYFIGFFGGSLLIKKIMTKYPKTEKGLSASMENFEKYANLSVCAGRVIPLCRTYISFVAGSSKQNYGKYLLFTTIGVVVWNATLLSLGYVFYDNLDYVVYLYKEYKVIVIIVVSLLILLFIIYKVVKKRKRKSTLK